MRYRRLRSLGDGGLGARGWGLTGQDTGPGDGEAVGVHADQVAECHVILKETRKGRWDCEEGCIVTILNEGGRKFG